jgi:hypothetical protein
MTKSLAMQQGMASMTFTSRSEALARRIAKLAHGLSRDDRLSGGDIQLSEARQKHIAAAHVTS